MDGNTSPCPNDKIRHKGYTRKNTGKYVKSVCVSRVHSEKHTCPPGQIPRASYVRHVSERVQREGYTRKTKTGKSIQVRPRSLTMKVKASCIKDKGKNGQSVKMTPARIGPLKKGELKKFGYVYKLPEHIRHESLKQAIKKLGALNVYHKLDAISKLSASVAPKAAAVFAADRNWVRKTYAGANGSLHAF